VADTSKLAPYDFLQADQVQLMSGKWYLSIATEINLLPTT